MPVGVSLSLQQILVFLELFPPDVSQVPKSALDEKIKNFKPSEMNMFER